MLSFTLTLPRQPLPLSQCFVNRRGGGRHESKEYALWKREADAHLVRFHAAALGTPNHPKIPGIVRVDITIRRVDRRKRDLDNQLKGPLDLLTRNFVIADDSRIIDLRVRWADVLEHPAVIVIENMDIHEARAA